MYNTTPIRYFAIAPIHPDHTDWYNKNPQLRPEGKSKNVFTEFAWRDKEEAARNEWPYGYFYEDLVTGEELNQSLEFGAYAKFVLAMEEDNLLVGKTTNWSFFHFPVRVKCILMLRKQGLKSVYLP